MYFLYNNFKIFRKLQMTEKFYKIMFKFLKIIVKDPNQRLNLLLKTNELIDIIEYRDSIIQIPKYKFLEEMFTSISTTEEEIHYFFENPTSIKIMMSWLEKHFSLVF